MKRGRPRHQLDVNRLRHLREELGWSLRRIARTVGVSKDTVRVALKMLSEKPSNNFSTATPIQGMGMVNGKAQER